MTFLKESSIDLHVYLSIYYRLGVAFFQWNFPFFLYWVNLENNLIFLLFYQFNENNLISYSK